MADSYEKCLKGRHSFVDIYIDRDRLVGVESRVCWCEVCGSYRLMEVVRNNKGYRKVKAKFKEGNIVKPSVVSGKIT